MTEHSGQTNPRTPMEPPSPEVLQAQLSGYEVTKLLGRGGMGAVYLGMQMSLDRPVAIKVLPPFLEGDDGSFIERFKREARAMAKLNHPGIVSVYDFGQTRSGLLYFVMEFIEGTDVQRMITQKKRLKPSHAHAITAHVCDALAYAHERGLIHRDIKPANIMISRDGEVKVADFGLAKAVNAGASGLTQSGMVLGTLHYMAPETLILGVDVDQRADIYAVGVMLYQMLTGRLPAGVFKLPSEQVEGLDPRFDDIIDRAMREDRTERYQSTREMREDLDVMLTHPVPAKKVPESRMEQAKPVSAPPPHAEMEFEEKFASTPPRTNWLPAVAVAVVVLILTFAIWRMLPRQQEEVSDASQTSAASARPQLPDPFLNPVPTPSAPSPSPTKSTTPSPTAAPKPKPAPTLAFSEYTRLLQMQATDWHHLVKKPYDDSMTVLGTSYRAALQRERDAAAGRGDADIYTQELARFQNDATPPPAAADDPKWPPRLLQLRLILRNEAARLKQERDTAVAAVKSACLGALTGLRARLVATKQDDKAEGVRQQLEKLTWDPVAFEELMAAQKVSIPATPAPVASTPPAPSPSPPATSTPPASVPITSIKETFDNATLAVDWKQQANAWSAVGGALWSSKVDHQNANDKGWGCWLARELPADVHVEFDATFMEGDSVIVCEMFSRPASASGVAGYRFILQAAQDETRPFIFRGMGQLPTESEKERGRRGSQEGLRRRMVIKRQGGTLTWMVDGRQHAKASDPAPLQGGWLGFRFQSGTVLIDNLIVHDLATGVQPNEPALANSGQVLLIGHLEDPRGRPGSQTLVRWLGSGGNVSTRTDELGRFALTNASSNTTNDLRGESPDGEYHQRLFMRSRTAFIQDIKLEKKDTVGIRWVLQPQTGNSKFDGAGTVAGEAYFSSSYNSIDLLRGANYDTSVKTTGTSIPRYDFRLYPSASRKVIFTRMTGTSQRDGWHLESLPFDQITAVNQGAPFDDKDYFYDGFKTGDAVRVGQVFTARNASSGTYAKIEIIHVPD